MKKKEYDRKFLRLVVIIYRLATTGRIRTTDLARAGGVTIRTVQRDLALIERGGFPLVRTPAGWQFVEGFRLNLPSFPNRRKFFKPGAGVSKKIYTRRR